MSNTTNGRVLESTGSDQPRDHPLSPSLSGQDPSVPFRSQHANSIWSSVLPPCTLHSTPFCPTISRPLCFVCSYLLLSNLTTMKKPIVIVMARWLTDTATTCVFSFEDPFDYGVGWLLSGAGCPTLHWKHRHRLATRDSTMSRLRLREKSHPSRSSESLTVDCLTV